jgi:hypothetical protein
VISPLLANIYLHYVYDLWAQAWRKRHATGDMIVVRYADDTIVGFQNQWEAKQFLHDLKERLAKFCSNSIQRRLCCFIAPTSQISD